jgi:tetratricopeptide (TPR) repeat protein
MNRLAITRSVSTAPDTAVLCATILVAPQLFGGAFPWSVLVIAGLCVASFGIALWVRRTDATPVLDGVFAVMGVAWLWTCLQAIALPQGLARALRLGSVESAERLNGLAWADATSLTISYEPGSTHLQILIGIAILSAFLAARLGGASGLRPIAVATAISAALLGLVGVAHEASGTTTLFGLYRPRFTATRMLAPLMNGNHLAGFSLLGALIAAGCAASTKQSRRRLPWIAVSIFCTSVLTWTLSRGAIGALLAGFGIFAAWLYRRHESAGARVTIPAAVAGATLLGVAAFAGLEPILRRFETEGFDKVEVALKGFRLLEGSAWVVGVGRGAFSSAFVFHEGLSDRYTHPENLIVQWTTEWGLPVALVLMLVLALALWKRFRSAEDPLVAVVCIAIFALSLQNLVDFSLEMAGVVVVVASLFGAVLPAQTKLDHGRKQGLLLTLLGVFVATLGLLGPGVLGSDTQSIVDRLTQYMKADDEARFEATLRRGLALHPGEPAIALLAGAYAGAKRHPDAPRWLAVVMDEAPDWGVPHAILADWLLAEGRIDQALLEVRLAEQRRPGSGSKVLCDVLKRNPQFEYVERAAPTDGARIAFLNRTASFCGGLPEALRLEIDEAILRSEPTHAPASLRKAKRLSTESRFGEATSLLEEALGADPNDVTLWTALIGTHLGAGDPTRALAVLEEAASQGIEARTLGEAKARIEARQGDTDAMRATLARLRGESRGNPVLLAQALMLEGELEGSIGNIDEALSAYEAADAASPAAPALQRAARLAAQSGRPSYARQTYRTLCHREPDGAACAEAARFSK